MNIGPSFLYYVQSAHAEDDEALTETECVDGDQCCIDNLCCFDDSPLSISALIVVPIIMFCIQMPLQKKWLKDAADDGLDYDLFIWRGRSLGFFLAVCGFIGLLYSPVTKQGMSSTGCGVPEGWLPLVVILGLISSILLIVSFVKKPTRVTG